MSQTTLFEDQAPGIGASSLDILKSPLRALSWKNPFAELMLHGKIETRVWATKYRGPVLICASQKSYSEMSVIGIAGEVQAQRIFSLLTATGTRERNEYAIAIGNLVHCREMHKADEYKCFVNYREPWIEERISKKTGKIRRVKMKLYCHIYENVRAIEPIPWKGSQGWREVPEEIKQTIKILAP